MSLLAVCGGGGNDVAGWLLVLMVLAAWLLVTVLTIRAAGRDRRERRLLTGLLIGSLVLGPVIINAFYEGFFGSDGDVGKLAVLLLIPGVLGVLIARSTRATNSVKAFLVSTWGAISLAGLGIVLLVAVLAVGNGCIE